jgi:hypothetical protein
MHKEIHEDLESIQDTNQDRTNKNLETDNVDKILQPSNNFADQAFTMLSLQPLSMSDINVTQ